VWKHRGCLESVQQDAISRYLKMWLLGMPYLEDMPCMDMVRKLLKHFEQMCEEGVKSDDITLVCLLSACSYAG